MAEPDSIREIDPGSEVISSRKRLFIFLIVGIGFWIFILLFELYVDEFLVVRFVVWAIAMFITFWSLSHLGALEIPRFTVRISLAFLIMVIIATVIALLSLLLSVAGWTWAVLEALTRLWILGIVSGVIFVKYRDSWNAPKRNDPESNENANDLANTGGGEDPRVQA